MGFFDDNEFGIEDFFNQITGGEEFTEYSSADSDGKKRSFRKNQGNTGRIPAKQIVTKKYIFLIFDFSGEKNIEIKIKDGKARNRYGEIVHTGQKILEIKNLSEIIGEYVLPEKIKVKGYEHTFNNGILEVKFRR